MDTFDAVAVTDAEGRRTLQTAAADLAAPVSCCSGWVVADVLSHTASVYRRTSHVLAHRLTDRPAGSDWFAEAPTGEALLEWFEAAHTEVVHQLGSAPPDQPVWTFHPAAHPVAFWRRRMAHETLVHRMDVELAVGAPTPVDVAVAVDGIDEALDVLVGPGLSGQHCGDEATLHLHATDADGEWLIRLHSEGITTDRSHAKGDAALRGPVAGLHAWLWGRAGTTDLEVFGDPTVVERTRQLVASTT